MKKYKWPVFRKVYKLAILTGQSLLKSRQRNGSFMDEEGQDASNTLCSEVYQCARK